MFKSNIDLFKEFVEKMCYDTPISKPHPTPQTKIAAPSKPVTKAPATPKVQPTPQKSVPAPSKPVAKIPTTPEVQPAPQKSVLAPSKPVAKTPVATPKVQAVPKVTLQVSTPVDNSESAIIKRLCERKDIIRFICDSMQYIEEGTFIMGDNKPKSSKYGKVDPEHKVHLTAFYCMKYPITCSLYLAILYEYPFNAKDLTPADIADITSNDFKLFVRRLNAITGLEFEVITECQREYIARAGENDEFSGCRGLLCIGEAPASDLGKPNPWGIYGMNYARRQWGILSVLAEWCRDMNSPYNIYSTDWGTDPVHDKFSSVRSFRCSDLPVYARNFRDDYNQYTHENRAITWTTRLVCKYSSKASDYFYQNKTFSW